MAQRTIPFEALLEGDQYLVHVSVLPDLVDVPLDLPRDSLLVPKSLDEKLQADPTPQIAALLTAAMLPPDPTPQEVEELTLTVERLAQVRAAYLNLLERRIISVISDEAGEALPAEVGSDAPQEPRVQFGLDRVETPRSLIRRHVGTLFAYSQATGTAILSRGRSLVSRVRGWITVIDFPDRAVTVIERKRRFTERWFPTPRARAVKFVVGMTIAVGGWVSFPVGVDIAGVAFATLDP